MKKDPKRDPNLDNYPYVVRVPGSEFWFYWVSEGSSKQMTVGASAQRVLGPSTFLKDLGG